MIQPVVHPGPAHAQRWITEVSPAVNTVAELQPGIPIMDALGNAIKQVAHEKGVPADCGYARFLGGRLAHVEYCYPTESRPGAPMPYGDTVIIENQEVVLGSAVIGHRINEEGIRSRWAHLHVLMKSTDDVLSAGHLWPQTITGEGLVVDITLTPGLQLVNALDEETRLPVFTPSSAQRQQTPEKMAPGWSEVAFTRVCPNVELAVAVRNICQSLGWTHASVRCGTGSLIGATMKDRATQLNMEVHGPATEVIALRGNYVQGQPVRLEATLVGSRGVVLSGQLQETGNLVAVTYELILERS